MKVIIHGWTEHVYSEWCMNLTEAYLKKGFYNVILVDWSSVSDDSYFSATRLVKLVGSSVGNFIVMLCKKVSVPYKNVHVIGHSLGAHVASFTGRKVFDVTGRKIYRITGLDPAAPIFDMINDRLSRDDAVFVDVVHTDGGFLGFKFSIGTVDFYPNGGTAVQPGCSLLKVNVKYEDRKCYFTYYFDVKFPAGLCLPHVVF